MYLLFISNLQKFSKVWKFITYPQQKKSSWCLWLGVELFSFVNFVMPNVCLIRSRSDKPAILCFKNFNNRQPLIDKEEDTISFNICPQIKKIGLNFINKSHMPSWTYTCVLSTELCTFILFSKENDDKTV